MILLKLVGGRRWSWLPVVVAASSLFSCAVGPKYQRPELNVPADFRRTTAAETAPPAIASNWWTLFNDPTLTRLAEETAAANLDIKAAMARLEQAHAATRSAAGNFLPTLDLTPSARRSGNTAGTATQYSLPLNLGYEVDVWGRLRRLYESNRNTEQATVADLEFVRQTAITSVAQSYFNIRLYDQQNTSFEAALDLYRKQLDLTDTKYKAGLSLPTDLLQARTQVNSAMSQLIEGKRARAREEHAIAILLGRPPTEVALEKAAPTSSIPVVPAGLPVNLLSRRPDVAQAEYRLAAANAQVGLAKANFFPSFSLNATAGFQSTAIGHLLDWENRIWSLAAGLGAPIFQGGQLSAALAQARARYEELVANYRLAVLRSFQDVEDQLSDLHLLAEKAQSIEDTLVSAREYSRLTEIQYRQGLTTYLQVIDANQTLLTNELSAAQAYSQRLSATVLLIRALGGGWGGISAPPQ